MAKRKKLVKGKPGFLKGKFEGGSGGRRGHGNMVHYTGTEEIKAAAKTGRRRQSKRLEQAALRNCEE